jgi:hypothetical protein
MRDLIERLLKEYIQDIQNNQSITTEESKSYKKPRKWSKSYCKKTPCDKMGFSQKASCRPYKNCY